MGRFLVSSLHGKPQAIDCTKRGRNTRGRIFSRKSCNLPIAKKGICAKNGQSEKNIDVFLF